ncbi:prolyl oligopeptidase family serine peptidase [Aquabacterium sp. A7-Y]|uniref:alpha/beta hydrolase family protein n=1 Tax=Aquabacterium sp. A7-Y TaxID=1349605 RepID=UPI00223DAEC0|nr:prolyl oligopeptidase family serine peptidase [Aquabacterium sp. A7-Y]MCW7537717.1 prolyl oligopeptidase family serine peptidase [Aquabacterium sp. A7-Y]
MKFRPPSRALPRSLSSLALTLLLAACGGSGGSDGADPTGAAHASRLRERGSTLSVVAVTTQDRPAISAAIDRLDIRELSGDPLCAVRIWRLSYATRTPDGRDAHASEALMVPTGLDPACRGPRPVVLYAHGTSTDLAKNMSDVKHDNEAAIVMAMFAARGYIVVAPNYLGYDGSSLDFHPYLHADSQSADMLDGLRAALAHPYPSGTASPARRLYVTGYSQGGHVAMATLRRLQVEPVEGLQATAGGPMSGPYDLAGMGDQVVAGTPVIGGTLFMPMVLTSFQRIYRDIYQHPSEVYQPPFDLFMDNLLPHLMPREELARRGLLPADDPGYSRVFGPGGLLTDSLRHSYAGSRLQAALRANSLLEWTPARPMALCGARNDPTVAFANTVAARAAFAARGVTVPAWDLEDVDSLPEDPLLRKTIHAGFQALARANDQPLGYHESALPFCAALMRRFFEKTPA